MFLESFPKEMRNYKMFRKFLGAITNGPNGQTEKKDKGVLDSRRRCWPKPM